jgi:hypothetical protein
MHFPNIGTSEGFVELFSGELPELVDASSVHGDKRKQLKGLDHDDIGGRAYASILNRRKSTMEYPRSAGQVQPLSATASSDATLEKQRN